MFETADSGRQAAASENHEFAQRVSEQINYRGDQRAGGLGHRSSDDLFQNPAQKSNDNLTGIDLDKSAEKIAGFLNNGRSDQAVNLLSKDLMKLSGEAYNQLLLKVSQNEDPEFDGDTNGHLLLSDWSVPNKTWSQVFVQERDQLYRIVQPGNTVKSIAADRLGNGAAPDAVNKYVKNICDVNSLPAAELVVRGQALKLPYPH